MKLIKGIINKAIDGLGYELRKKNAPEVLYPEFSEFERIYTECRPYTMTSQERMFALYKSVEYIIKNDIPGDFVECGVWRGGCPMIITKTLLMHGITDRKIWLFDTFEGMSQPTVADKDMNNLSAEEQMQIEAIRCYASLEDVKSNMIQTGYPEQNIQYIKGKVEDTLSNQSFIKQCALLRLDTDWYESTLIELKELFPTLVKNGIMIIDDYGHWQGCKKAVDEYLKENNLSFFLNRIDYSGRLVVKAT